MDLLGIAAVERGASVHLVPLLDNYGATAMFAAVLVALAATIAVIAPIGPRTTGRSLDEINPT